MNELHVLQALKVLLSLSLSGTLLFLFLYILRPLYQNRLSKSWQYYIWLIVCARFLLPLTPSASISSFLFHATESAFNRPAKTASPAESNTGADRSFSEDTAIPAENNTGTDNAFSENAAIPAENNTGTDKNFSENTVLQPAKDTFSDQPQADYAGENFSNSADAGPTDKNFSDTAAAGTVFSADSMQQHALFYLALAQAAVAGMMALRRIIVYRRFCRCLKAQNTAVTDRNILDQLSDCMEKLRIRRRVELCQNPLIASPMTVGCIHPHIILPAETICSKDLRFIFMHELIHIKRFDLLYKWLVQTVLCIHWLNPSAYLLVKKVNRACELSCDEAVLGLLEQEKDKKAYGDMLLSFVKAGSTSKHYQAPVMLTEGAEQLKERLGAIMDYKKKTKTVTAASAVFTALACFLFTALGAYAAPLQPAQDTAKSLQPPAQSSDKALPQQLRNTTSEKKKTN